MLRYSSQPSVTVLAGTVHSSYDPATGDEKLGYTHSGLARVLISGGGRRPLLLMIGTDATVAPFWQTGTANGGTQADSDSNNPNPGPGNFPIPPGLLKPGENAVISVLVENMGNNDDWIADDNRFKQPRGLYDVSVMGSSEPITWKIQGARGGQNLPDPVRGPLNNGGLYGERSGWYLPGYPTASWSLVPSTSQAVIPAGVTWYRTSFRLNLPPGQDVPVDLRFGGSQGRFRVIVFLNGWNVGQYINDIGPQHDFALPAGLLRAHGLNTLALAVIAQDGGVALGPIGLVAKGDVRGGVLVADVPSPSYGQLPG